MTLAAYALSRRSSWPVEASNSFFTFVAFFSTSASAVALSKCISFTFAATTSGMLKTCINAAQTASSTTGTAMLGRLQVFGSGWLRYLSEHLYRGLPWHGYPYSFLPQPHATSPLSRKRYLALRSDNARFFASLSWAAVNSFWVMMLGTLIGIHSSLGLSSVDVLRSEE